MYQRYLGWFDANPAHLHPHPPVAAAPRYVEFMGGATELLARAQLSYDDGDYRLGGRGGESLVFARAATTSRHGTCRPTRSSRSAMPASPVRGATSISRVALELRSNGTMLKGVRGNALGSGIVRSMTCELLLDLIGVRLNGPRAADARIEVNLNIIDRARHGRSAFDTACCMRDVANRPPSGPRGGCNPRGICGPGIGVDDARRVARTE